MVFNIGCCKAIVKVLLYNQYLEPRPSHFQAQGYLWQQTSLSPWPFFQHQRHLPELCWTQKGKSGLTPWYTEAASAKTIGFKLSSKEPSSLRKGAGYKKPTSYLRRQLLKIKEKITMSVWFLSRRTVKWPEETWHTGQSSKAGSQHLK